MIKFREICKILKLGPQTASKYLFASSELEIEMQTIVADKVYALRVKSKGEMD